MGKTGRSMLVSVEYCIAFFLKKKKKKGVILLGWYSLIPTYKPLTILIQQVLLNHKFILDNCFSKASEMINVATK